jgi:hypothetical protein
MARDPVTITALAIDAGTNAPAGTTITADGVSIAAGGNTGKLLITITHTDTLTNDATIVAPTDSPQAVRSSLGSIVSEFAPGNVTPVVRHFVIESARFARSDGSIWIDFEADFTGTVTALRLPDEA